MTRRLLTHCLLRALLPFTAGGVLNAHAQSVFPVSVFPYAESFDSVAGPGLPGGWESTRNRTSAAADMTVSQTAPRSFPNCVSATNATVAQALTSPEFDFSLVNPDTISWFMRRSSTFTAPVVVEYSSDGGNAWIPVPGDTLLSDGSAAYEETARVLPHALAGMSRVRLRWRIVPVPTGSAGTLRFDDIRVTAHAAKDLSLVRVIVAPQSPRSSEAISVTAIVKNVGLVPLSDATVRLYTNCGDPLRPDACSLIAQSAPSTLLAPGDTLRVALPEIRLGPGLNPLIAVLQEAEDMDRSDDSCRAVIEVGARPGGVVINEIMFAPFADEGEYVELMNAGGEPVSLTGWHLTFRTESSTARKILTLPVVPVLLGPGSCAVVAEDSGIFRYFPWLRGADSARVVIPPAWEIRLTNTGGSLDLLDPPGNLIDSVQYSPSWHNPAVVDRTGRSLERVLPSGGSSDPGNWSTCTLPEGGTPARANSVALALRHAAGTLSAFPNPFSPDGDGRDDATVISYSIPTGVWSVSIRIFDARGRLIRTLATSTPSTGSGEIIWDGRDDRRLTGRMGIYVVFLEATDAGRLSSFSAKGVVVLAHRLN